MGASLWASDRRIRRRTLWYLASPKLLHFAHPGVRLRGEVYQMPDEKADPICALCDKVISPTSDKMTVQGVVHHTECWDRKERRRK